MKKVFVLITAGVGLVAASLNGCVGDEPATTGAADASTDATTGEAGTCDSGNLCGSTCVDTQTDSANCGTCGNACTTGFNCVAGVCGNMPVQLAAWNSTTCTLLASGDVYCWGYGAFGAIGNGSNTDAHAATKVATDATGAPFGGVAQISVGYTHACALKSDGSIFCWGENKEGVLATTPSVAINRPTELAAFTGKAITSSGANCLLDKANGVDCWGYNANDQLGHDAGTDGDYSNCISGAGPTSAGTTDICNPTPKPVSGVAGVTQVSTGGNNTCVLQNGSVWCWGQGNSGVSGSTGSDSATPTQILIAGNPLTDISSVVVGGGSACAITKTMTLLCWGFNTEGQLGTGALSMPSASASPFGTLTNVTAATIGEDINSATQICAVSNGNVYCAGRNAELELGTGPSCNSDGGLPDGGGQCISTVPAPVMNPTGTGMLGNVVEVSANAGSTCARTSDGKIYCWGLNQVGQLGHDPGTNQDLNCINIYGAPPTFPCNPLPTLVSGLP